MTTLDISRTLLLSRGYEPVKIIPWQRAVSLLALEKADVVDEYDADVRSPSVVIKVPSIVRLRNPFRRRPLPVKFSRVNIYTRDGHRCQYCGTKCTIAQLTYDHVVPRSRGGRTSWENIVSCCVPCNRDKANRTPAEANMILLATPARPRWMPSVQIRVSATSVPDAWRDYVYWTTEIDHEASAASE